MNIWWLGGIWALSFLAAAAAGPLVIALYRKLGLEEDPKKMHHPKVVHTYPVPRGGGLVIAAGLFATVWFLMPWSPALTGVMTGAIILLITGVLDDKYDINPYVRYFFNLAAGLAVILGGVGIHFVTNPFGPGVISLDVWQIAFQLGTWQFTFSPLADGLALLWIVWNMNAVNWSKGVDGQMPGFVTIAAFVAALLSLRFQADQTQGIVTLLALSVSGAFAGLLLWNAYPQKMMPGYAGGSLAGYFLAVLSVLSGAKLATMFLLLAIPTADGVFAVVRRIASGRSPFWGDRGHLHHRLLDAGWSKPKIAYFYWGTTLAFGLIALQLTSKAKFYAMMAVGIAFVALVLWLRRSISFSAQPDRVSGSKTSLSSPRSSSRVSSSTSSRRTSSR